jgi:DNA-binding NarL/FixJ family response regulator
MAAAEGDRRFAVLVADDDEDIRQLLMVHLSRDPFEVAGTARNAEEAVELALARRPDAVLVDVNMPGGGGRRVIEALQRAAPEIAVVVVSALDEDGLVRDLLRRGAMAYLVKPVSRDEVLSAVERAVAANAALRA